MIAWLHPTSLMYKKSFVLLLVFFFSVAAMAQQRVHKSTDQINSLNWSILATINYVLNDKNQFSPVYSESVKRFKDKPFDLEGYLIPVKARKTHDTFLLSPLPVNQCHFCGANGIPAMIYVEAKQPITFTSKTIHITGILRLDETGDVPVRLVEAELF
ncbi:hypothetical protein D3C87_406210 [compost metagenome]